jgi:hypothetical protein
LGQKKSIFQAQTVESELAPLLYGTYQTDAAYDQACQLRKAVVRTVCPVDRRVQPLTLKSTVQAAKNLLSLRLGPTSSLPTRIVYAPSASRHKIGKGYFHSSEKIHCSNIPPMEGAATTALQLLAITNVITQLLTNYGINRLLFEVEARVLNSVLVAKIGLPGKNMVQQLTPLLRNAFPEWTIKEGFSRLYEQEIHCQIADCICDMLRTVDEAPLFFNLGLTKATAFRLRLCIFIDGWSQSLFIKTRLVGPYHPCFFFRQEFHMAHA